MSPRRQLGALAAGAALALWPTVAFYGKAGVNTHAMSLGLILDFSKRI